MNEIFFKKRKKKNVYFKNQNAQNLKAEKIFGKFFLEFLFSFTSISYLQLE